MDGYRNQSKHINTISILPSLSQIEIVLIKVLCIRGVVCEQCWGKMTPTTHQVSAIQNYLHLFNIFCKLSTFCCCTAGLSALQHGVLLQQQLQSGWHCRTQIRMFDSEQIWDSKTLIIRSPAPHCEDLAENTK